MTRADAEITLAAYRRHPVLIRDLPTVSNPWGLTFLRAFDMANDSYRFRDQPSLNDAESDGWAYQDGATTYLPLYEAKMLWHFDHRLSSYALRAPGSQDTELPRLSDRMHDDPTEEAGPRYWVDQRAVDKRLGDRWDRNWLLGWRDIARGDDLRTMAPCVLPRAATADALLLALPLDPEHGYLLHATWSSLACDYLSR